MYDVMIVGAGPGGSFAAQLLAKAGYDVLLVEKEALPRDKPCAGWITPKVLQLIDLSPSKLACFQPMHGAVIWLTEKKDLIPYVVRYQKPISYGIRRIEFDSQLITKAKDAGVEVVDHTPVTTVYRQKNAVFVQAGNNQEFKGRFVIGADGTHSTVANSLWIRKKWKPTELIQCVVSETDVGEKARNLTEYPGFAELFLNVNAMGYSWYFTKGQYLSIGSGIQLDKITAELNTKAIYQEHLDKLNQIHYLDGIKLDPIKAHTYPVYCGPYHYSTYGDRVLLVGDAGGFPINFTGEGIRTALLSGQFAAETLIGSLETGQTDVKDYFKKWSTNLRDEYLMGDVLQMIASPNYFELVKSIFIQEPRFRRLFFDLFFNVKNPRQALRQFLIYSPLLYYRLLRFGFRSLLNYILSF
jgi:geranylgeranyl reductase family protein